MTSGVIGSVGAVLSNAADQAMSFALAQVGKPYQWGGTGPNSFDCSGLTQAAYKSAGISIPRTALLQSHSGTAVGGISAALPGDLIFPFVDESHVCMYLGNNQIVEAPQTGEDVHVIAYYASAGGIRRFVAGGGTPYTSGLSGNGVNSNSASGVSTTSSTVFTQLANISKSLTSTSDWASFAYLLGGAGLLLAGGLIILGGDLL